MDIKITRQRIDRHLEYDWIKYILIIIAAAGLWLGVYSMADNPRAFETIDFFVSTTEGYNSEGERKMTTYVFDALQNDGDEVIRRVSSSYFMTEEQYMTSALVCDFYIGDSETFGRLAEVLLPLDADVLTRCGISPDELAALGTYYGYVDEENSVLRENPVGIRIPSAQLNEWLPRIGTDENGAEVVNEYYIGFIGPNYVGGGENIGDYNSKPKRKMHAQAFDVLRVFLDYYSQS